MKILGHATSTSRVTRLTLVDVCGQQPSLPPPGPPKSSTSCFARSEARANGASRTLPDRRGRIPSIELQIIVVVVAYRYYAVTRARVLCDRISSLFFRIRRELLYTAIS